MRSTTASLTRRFGVVLALAASLALILAVFGCDGGPAAQPGESVTVSYRTEDGVNIAADWELPADVEMPAVVILLHHFQGSRRQWRPLVPKLVEAGYAVLAPDLRSFGGSLTIERDGKKEIYELDDPEDMLLDVSAAIQFVQEQDGVDLQRIAVIGASVGGNLAYVASGSLNEVKTTIVMSPSTLLRGGALLGTDIDDFNPHSILFMSDVAEAIDSQRLAANVEAPVEIKIYPSAERVHGVALLANPKAITDILDWLDETL